MLRHMKSQALTTRPLSICLSKGRYTYGRIRKVARTIADLRESDTISLSDVAEAVQFRMIDAKYWGNSKQ